ncbi:NAD(P)-binding protein [bacterium]|nr:NAD(P)-binding protein [bacterium]
MDKKYDIGIIGAGLAGASLALLLNRKGYSVVIFEQQDYPEHKVCGEFLSNESIPFFESLGVDFKSKKLPVMNIIGLSSQAGYFTQFPLIQGGTGISRYALDHELMELMKQNGIVVHSPEKVLSVKNDVIESKERKVRCKIIVGAHGKYKPGYLQSAEPKSSRNYIGVKYHVNYTPLPENEIQLHSFDGGYCGINKIEEGKSCLCYLVDSQHLKTHKGSFQKMEQEVLSKNPQLRKIFRDAEQLWDQPTVISNIKFGVRSFNEQSVLNIGDAAACISPLSGNGMSMAAKSALLLSNSISSGKAAHEIHREFQSAWKTEFDSRVNRAKVLNTIMLNPRLNDLSLKLMSFARPLGKRIVNSMQGKTFIP